jgi:hypothetical protein
VVIIGCALNLRNRRSFTADERQRDVANRSAIEIVQKLPGRDILVEVPLENALGREFVRESFFGEHLYPTTVPFIITLWGTKGVSRAKESPIQPERVY